VTPVVVLDSSALVALLADSGPAGEWVSASATDSFLAAPALTVSEAANTLRRHQLAGLLEPGEASMAHRDLLLLPLQRWPYDAVAERAWELRGTLTLYDASYVALAERLDADVITLDDRLARATGPRCAVRTPGPAELPPDATRTAQPIGGARTKVRWRPARRSRDGGRRPHPPTEEAGCRTDPAVPSA
jgi:predicted nucleic acid-binding protein